MWCCELRTKTTTKTYPKVIKLTQLVNTVSLARSVALLLALYVYQSVMGSVKNSKKEQNWFFQSVH